MGLKETEGLPGPCVDVTWLGFCLFISMVGWVWK